MAAEGETKHCHASIRVVFFAQQHGPYMFAHAHADLHLFPERGQDFGGEMATSAALPCAALHEN
jgi:hypothetical protein